MLSILDIDKSMRKENLFISVIIVTYNRLELLKECIYAVKHQTRKFDECIVVDNCSTDDTQNYLKSVKDICTYKLNKNIGGAGGFAYGITKISNLSDFVLLIDDDAILDNNFLKNILDNMVEGIDAYSGVVKTNNIINTNHRRLVINSIFMINKNVKASEYDKEYFEYDISSFCGLLISTSIINKIGIPNGNYFIWYDDSEYSYRIRKYTNIRNINSSIINHKTFANGNGKLSWKSFYGYRNEIDIGKKHSKCPAIYLIYRYSYHIFCGLQHYIKYLLLKKQYDFNCSRLHYDVVIASINNRMGFDERYNSKVVI